MDINSFGTDIFISYSHDDAKVVEKIKSRLENYGLSCWLDQERLKALDQYNPAICDGIENAALFLACLSKSYVFKHYCSIEYSNAIDLGKTILAICLDDVHRTTCLNAKHYFTYHSGITLPGYNQILDFRDEAGIEKLVQEVMESVAVQTHLKSRTDPNHILPAVRSRYIQESLQHYHERQYQRSGNYIQVKIRNQLYPELQDTRTKKLYVCASDQPIPLLQVMDAVYRSNAKSRHILICGEGGIGKTVSLLTAGAELLKKNEIAIYIPLSRLNRNLTLEDYLKQEVCRGEETTYRYLQAALNTGSAEDPSVYFLLDGVNEICPEYLQEFMKHFRQAYLNTSPGLRVIMTSRWEDPLIFQSIEDRLHVYQVQPLNETRIRSYLESCDLHDLPEQAILDILRTPLLLVLYAGVEKERLRADYGRMPGIHLIVPANSPAKIVHNYLQTQIFRAAEEEMFDLPTQLFLLDFMLPALAFEMTSRQAAQVTRAELDLLIDELEEDKDEPRARWYRQTILSRQSLSSVIHYSELKALAVHALHLLIPAPANSRNQFDSKSLNYSRSNPSGTDELVFPHQVFRDYFAARHVANEIQFLQYVHQHASKKKKIKLKSSILSQNSIPAEVTDLTADLLEETLWKPELTSSGWKCKGPSPTEQVLRLWAGKQKNYARIAVANLYNVLNTAREGLLFGCDFSKLDLRKCSLKGARFSEFWNDQLIPSCFDEAFLDLPCMIQDGHEENISAIAVHYPWVVTGDWKGTVRIYDLQKKRFCKVLKLQDNKNDVIRDLCFDPEGQKFIVVYTSRIYEFHLSAETWTLHTQTSRFAWPCRYGRYSHGHIQIASAYEPLRFFDLTTSDFVQTPAGLDPAKPARCAIWAPDQLKAARTTYDQNVLLFKKVLPDSLARSADSPQSEAGLCHTAKQAIPDAQWDSILLDLSQWRRPDRDRISSLSFHPSGDRLLITCGCWLLEYNIQDKTWKKKKDSQLFRDACYADGSVYAGCGSRILILDEDGEDWIVRSTIPGSNASEIRHLQLFPDGSSYFFIDQNRELKQLSKDLQVMRIRYLKDYSLKTPYTWAIDPTTEQIFLFHLSDQSPHGVRFDFWSGEQSDPESNYILLPRRELSSIYSLGKSVMKIEEGEIDQSLFFTNYSGVCIYGCSFRHICDDQPEAGLVDFLKQNGGVC